MLREDSGVTKPLACDKRSNGEMCKAILDFHVEKGCLVVDLTYGYGSFQKLLRGFEVVSCDIRRELLRGVRDMVNLDFHVLPFRSGIVGALIYDPPYTGEDGGRGGAYENWSLADDSYAISKRREEPFTAEQLRDFHRVLSRDGVLVWKDIHERRFIPFFQQIDLFIQDLSYIPAFSAKKAIRNYAFWNVLKKEG